MLQHLHFSYISSQGYIKHLITPNIERGRIVRKMGEKIAERRETFIDLLQEEQGKDYELASGEVDLAIDYFEYMSEWARRIEGDIVPSDRSK